MAFETANRVKVATTTTGTADFGLGSATSTAFQDFTVLTDGARVHYTAYTSTEFECGEGIYTASGPTLSRDTIFASSNTNLIVTFGSSPTIIVTPLVESVALLYDVRAVVNVLAYEAVGDGVTDDTTAIANALAAAQAANKPLLFPAGYTFLMGTLTLTGDNWHIIIERDCTVKLKSDGGVANTTGLFNLTGSKGRLDNYGTIDGNKVGQTAFTNIGAASVGLIYSSADLDDFVYSNGGVGVITNTAMAAVIVNDPLNFTIDGIIISDGPVAIEGDDDSSGPMIKVRRPIGFCIIRGGRMTTTGMSGLSVSKNTAPAIDTHILIEDYVVDWRGCTMPDLFSNGITGYIAFETFAFTPNVRIVNCTVWGPEGGTVGDQCYIAGTSHGSTHNLRVFGGDIANVTRGYNITYGIECSNYLDTVHEGFILDECLTGISVNSNAVAYARLNGTISNCRFAALNAHHRGHVDADLTIIDCGSNNGDTTPTIAFTDQAATGDPATMDLRVTAIYEDLDETVNFLVVSEPDRKLTMHDSRVINLMATPTSQVRIQTMEGNDCSFVNCEFIGQGNNGTAITSVGDALRIQNCRFVDYSSPWNTSGGTNSIIIGNDTSTCTSPNGTTDATDYVDVPRGKGPYGRLISSGSWSGATGEVTWTGSYDFITLVVHARPATDDVEAYLRVSTDSGATYDSSGYSYAGSGGDSNGTYYNTNSSSDSQIKLTGVPGANDAVGNAAGEFITFVVEMHSPTAAAVNQFIIRSGWAQADGGKAFFNGTGSRNNGQDLNGLQLLFESGNITSATYTLFGS